MKIRWIPFFPAFVVACIASAQTYTISTLAGNGTAGFSGDNGAAAEAQLNMGSGGGITVDSAGNVYVSDTNNERIRKISGGVIATVAGSGAPVVVGVDGPALESRLGVVSGIAVDSNGSLYFAGLTSNRILKVANGAITTVAGTGTAGFSGDNGPATSADLHGPAGVAVDSAGSLYIVDIGNQRIRKVSNGVITTVAGNGKQALGGDDGPATSVPLNSPHAIAVDLAGNIYIADGDVIRRISNGVITTVAGNGKCCFTSDNGPATSAQFGSPQGVATDFAGNLYIADYADSRILKVANGVIATVAGNGKSGFSGDNGPATSAQLTYAASVAVDSLGRVYFVDFGNNRIRVLTPSTVPVINQGGIVPIYSSVSIIQPGSWVSLYGTNLASATTLWNNDFPTSLGGTTVTIDNKPAYLWVVSPTQINLQVPDDSATGPVSVVVTTPSGTATSTVTLAAQAPSFSLLGDNKHVAAEIARPNGTYDLLGPSDTFSFFTRPVKPGETLTLFGVGFGPTTPAVAAGKVFSGSAPTTASVTVTIGGVNAPVAYSGMTQEGLYQINLTVPNAPSGDQPIVATINGVQTPPGPVVTLQ